jgi:hypothetical protein
MSDPQEFCAGVRILIERMQTNPEDFADEEHDLANMRRTRAYKFSAIASRLERIITGHLKDEVLAKWPEWHYLTPAEQDALLAAYKSMRRTEFDRRIMERVFDDKFYERQDEENQQHIYNQQMQAQMKAQMLGAQNLGPLSGQQGLGQITNLQPGGIYATTNNVSPNQTGGFFGFLGLGKKK